MVSILAILTSSGYTPRLTRILTDADDIEERILFVSLNKTYRSLLRYFEDIGLDDSRFWIVDGITSQVVSAKTQDRCIYVRVSADVRPLFDAILAIISEQNISLVIFDSLSALTTYKNIDEVIEFTGKMIADLAALNCSIVFTCLKSDEQAHLIEHTRMKVDKIYQFD